MSHAQNLSKPYNPVIKRGRVVKLDKKGDKASGKPQEKLSKV